VIIVLNAASENVQCVGASWVGFPSKKVLNAFFHHDLTNKKAPRWGSSEMIFLMSCRHIPLAGVKKK